MTYSVLKVPLNPNQPTNLWFVVMRYRSVVDGKSTKTYTAMLVAKNASELAASCGALLFLVHDL